MITESFIVVASGLNDKDVAFVGVDFVSMEDCRVVFSKLKSMGTRFDTKNSAADCAAELKRYHANIWVEPFYQVTPDDLEDSEDTEQ